MILRMSSLGSLVKNGTAGLLVAALVSTGCLSSTYRIPHDDLQALTMVAPAERGQKVRVVQNVGDRDDPPAATRVESSTTVIIVSDGGGSSSRPAPARAGTGMRPGGGYGPSGKLAADDAKAWIVIAAIATVALATTEGARYDGWVAMHPMMPVHLFGPDGEYMVVPLAQLTPEQAAWADHAVVRDTEGPWQEMGRAPLDRAGFSYSLLFGSAQMPSFNEDKDPGFQGHIQFGYFPLQQLGLQLDIGLGSRSNEMGLTVFDGRYALEADLYPLAAGAFHAGLFGQVGKAQRIEDGGPEHRDRNGNLFGAGALVQLELTTRLALTGRLGYASVMGEGATEAALGLSIY
jgi:hypothetical protein